MMDNFSSWRYEKLQKKSKKKPETTHYNDPHHNDYNYCCQHNGELTPVFSFKRNQKTCQWSCVPCGPWEKSKKFKYTKNAISRVQTIGTATKYRVNTTIFTFSIQELDFITTAIYQETSPLNSIAPSVAWEDKILIIFIWVHLYPDASLLSGQFNIPKSIISQILHTGSSIGWIF